MPRPKPYVPATPSRSWTEMLAAFMEQRNIRWGELIGGLLFVCSSVALVVSLWKTLEQIPYFKFFIFVSISSAVFGVGLYAHHRWKLESTSRALLVIAMLLVPLNFVAMAIMATAANGRLDAWSAKLVSLAIFAYLGRPGGADPRAGRPMAGVGGGPGRLDRRAAGRATDPCHSVGLADGRHRCVARGAVRRSDRLLPLHSHDGKRPSPPAPLPAGERSLSHRYAGISHRHADRRSLHAAGHHGLLDGRGPGRPGGQIHRCRRPASSSPPRTWSIVLEHFRFCWP